MTGHFCIGPGQQIGGRTGEMQYCVNAVRHHNVCEINAAKISLYEVTRSQLIRGAYVNADHAFERVRLNDGPDDGLSDIATHADQKEIQEAHLS